MIVFGEKDLDATLKGIGCALKEDQPLETATEFVLLSF